MNKKLLTKTISTMLLGTMAFYTMPVFAFVKDETIYSDLDSKGNPYKTIVSTHLKNEEKEKVLNDISDLLNIENTNGDEEFNKDGNNLIWDANGKDIYYQGESQKELPIEVNVKYELNGEELSKEEIVGKSGKVKITLEYTNKDEHNLLINGRYEKLYTPFVVVAGTTIENDNNSNIEISNGKVINDGTKTIVLGIALPGMQQSLGIDKDTVSIPNNIEITMETTSFEFNNIITYVTPKIIEENDLSVFDKLDGLYSKVNSVKKASKQIETGANELKDGTNLYAEKSKEFNNAINQFSNGVASANNSYTEINSGISTLNESSNKLNTGANQIASGTEAITTNLETIDTKLGEVQTGITALQNGEKELKAGLTQILGSVSKITATDNSEKITELKGLVQKNEETIKSLQFANNKIDAIEDVTLKESFSEQYATNAQLIQLLVGNNKALNATIETLEATDMTQMITLKSGLENVSEGIDKLSEGTDTLYAGVSQIKGGTSILSEKSKELQDGAKTLSAGTEELSNGTSKLNVGSNQMKNGLNTLNTSSIKLTVANNSLVDGAETIFDGANTLADGISTFNKEAIEKIVNYINGDLNDIATRAEKLQNLANEYNNFTMMNDGTEGKVKFIMIIDSIKKQEEETNKQEMLLNEEVKEIEE